VDFDEVEGRKLPLLYEAAGNFLDAGRATHNLLDCGSSSRVFAGPRLAGWLITPSMPNLPASSRPAVDGVARAATSPPPGGLAKVAAKSGRALAQEQRCSCFLPAMEEPPRGCRAKTESDSRRCGHLRQHGFGGRVGASGLFELDEELKPVHVAGVPPDYFSPTGQRWGNPLYRWEVLEERGFDWWIDRIRRATAALRHRSPGPLPRLRGLLGDSGGREDGGEGGMGEGAGAEAVPRAGGGAGTASAGGRGPGADYPRRWRSARELECRG